MIIKSMEIKRLMIHVNEYSRPGRFIGDDIRGIVIHYTGNPGSTPEQNIKYFDSLRLQAGLPGSPKPKNPRYASAHFFVGTDGDVWQCIPTSEMAYHVGAASYKKDAVAILGSYPNSHTLGIELCHKTVTGEFTEETLEAASELASLLLIEYGLTPEKNLFRHYDVTGKMCPLYFVNHEEQWKLFIERVKAKMNK